MMMAVSEFFRSCAAAVSRASCVRTISSRWALSAPRQSRSARRREVRAAGTLDHARIVEPGLVRRNSGLPSPPDECEIGYRTAARNDECQDGPHKRRTGQRTAAWRDAARVVFLFDLALPHGGNVFAGQVGRILEVVLERGRPAPSQKACIEGQAQLVLVRSCLLPENPIRPQLSQETPTATRERRSLIAADRVRVTYQRLTIGCSAAGAPRTYRLFRSWPLSGRLAALLTRLMR